MLPKCSSSSWMVPRTGSNWEILFPEVWDFWFKGCLDLFEGVYIYNFILNWWQWPSTHESSGGDGGVRMLTLCTAPALKPSDIFLPVVTHGKETVCQNPSKTRLCDRWQAYPQTSFSVILNGRIVLGFFCWMISSLLHHYLVVKLVLIKIWKLCLVNYLKWSPPPRDIICSH